MSAAVTGGAFAEGFSLLHGDWIDVEIVGVPYVCEGGYPVVEVFAPAMVGLRSYTIAALSQLKPRSRLARELLRVRR